MTQLLRVGIGLPTQQRGAVVDYLHRQPLLPTWRLSLVLLGPRTHADRQIHVAVATPAYGDRSSPSGRRGAPVVVVASHASTDISSTIGTPGVRAVVITEDPPETLALAIAAAVTHGVWLPERVWQQLEQPPVVPGSLGAIAALTPTERETLGLLAQGLTNTEIAATRRVRLSTVKYHIGNIRHKTGATTRHQLIVLARHSQQMPGRPTPPPR